MVIVYVGDTPGAVTAARNALAASGDPNRPVFVTGANQIAVGLTITLLVTPGMDTHADRRRDYHRTHRYRARPVRRLEHGHVGQTLFDSQIEAAILSVSGAVAITKLSFTANGGHQKSELHLPGDGGFYTLATTDLNLSMEPDPNG